MKSTFKQAKSRRQHFKLKMVIKDIRKSVFAYWKRLEKGQRGNP